MEMENNSNCDQAPAVTQNTPTVESKRTSVQTKRTSTTRSTSRKAGRSSSISLARRRLSKKPKTPRKFLMLKRILSKTTASRKVKKVSNNSSSRLCKRMAKLKQMKKRVTFGKTLKKRMTSMKRHK